ncbi:hypothetical protein FACS1894145_5860 [Bacteroidia bacterium]|nr:hypothetical protein FACS1894145_5860 [Bacteroidia bacterium]
MQTLRFSGIHSVSYCLSEKTQIDHHGLYNQPNQVKLLNDTKEIPIVGLARMETSEDNKSGETIYTTKLLFDMAISDCAGNIKNEIMTNTCCFVATDQKRVRRLIGLKEKPHPVVTATCLNEEKPTGKVLYSIEITYINNLPLFILH